MVTIPSRMKKSFVCQTCEISLLCCVNGFTPMKFTVSLDNMCYGVLKNNGKPQPCKKGPVKPFPLQMLSQPEASQDGLVKFLPRGLVLRIFHAWRGKRCRQKNQAENKNVNRFPTKLHTLQSQYIQAFLQEEQEEKSNMR